LEIHYELLTSVTIEVAAVLYIRRSMEPRMTQKKYTNAAQQRVLQTLRILMEHPTGGIAHNEIARALKTLPSNTTRGLANLRIAGFAESCERRWRLPPQIQALAAKRA
jgi:hypothetical protein